MKKIIGSSLAIVALALTTLTTNATLVFNEPFSYADGTLTNVSANLWNAFSGGGSGSIQVSSGKAVVTQAAAEDVARALTGSPYTNLYASFVVNFSAVTPPSGAGGYFFLFKDNGTSNFRARVFATTNGVTLGKYRVGIANAGNVFIPVASDLDYGSDYKLVVRLIGGTNATLWIAPTSESSIVNRADGTDTTTVLGISTVAMRQSLASGAGMGALTFDDMKVGTTFGDVQTIGGPPSISGLANVSIAANTNTGPMGFVISDVENGNSNLTVSATSDNPTLVPNNPANLTFGGPFTNSTLTVTPAASQQGVAGIQVVVTDLDGLKATNSFTITVGSPSISVIPNKTTPSGTPTSVSLWVNDRETAPGSLTVTAFSSDQGVLPDANIGVFNPGTTNRTLFLTNGTPGFAVVSVVVTDGTFSLTNTFSLTAAPDNGILLADDFSYTDGSIVANSAGNAPNNWNNHSGTNNETQVLSGKLLLNNTNSEDIDRFFTNSPIASTSGQIIYTRMVVNFSALPTANSTGEYFTHIYGFSGLFKARVFAITNGAALGKFRFNITSGGFTTGNFPQDIGTNENHVIITAYNTATAEATLWVDPVSESSTSEVASDVSAPGTVYGIAFRQATGIGTMTVDDLVMGSTFNEVLLVLPSSNADLGSLTLSTGTLAPTFASGTTNYTANVPNATAAITVTPTAANINAAIQVQVNGGGFATVASGSPSGSLALNVGTNAVDVKVTSQDASTIKTYTVLVIRDVGAPTPPSPEAIAKVVNGSNLILSWSQTNWTGLLTGTNLTGVTNEIPGATSPYTNALSGPQNYFRLYYKP